MRLTRASALALGLGGSARCGLRLCGALSGSVAVRYSRTRDATYARLGPRPRHSASRVVARAGGGRMIARVREYTCLLAPRNSSRAHSRGYRLTYRTRSTESETRADDTITARSLPPPRLFPRRSAVVALSWPHALVVLCQEIEKLLALLSHARIITRLERHASTSHLGRDRESR